MRFSYTHKDAILSQENCLVFINNGLAQLAKQDSSQFRRYSKISQTQFVISSEILVYSNKIDELFHKFGFDHWFSVDKVRMGGGLAIM